MVVTLGYYPGDRDQAVRLANWMNELGSYPNHELYILRDIRCEPIPELGQTFGKRGEIIAHAQIDGWPAGANYFFRTITSHLSYRTDVRYFFWMEPDAIPITSNWLDKIEEEFLKCGKKFMGDRVEVENIPLHQSGVGVYPNPLHAFAGEAYRAADEAFDMAGRHQIVPQAHFTLLINHAWKHPTFTDPHELKTQIRPEAVLFHASKDGSLIKLLRENLTAVPVLTEPQMRSLDQNDSGEARESNIHPKAGECPASRIGLGRDSRGGSQPSYDIFIRTYPKDYRWLSYCLQSAMKFANGFRHIMVVSPDEPPPLLLESRGKLIPYNLSWKVMNEETEDGYLAQQIHKLYADVITDYESDYILFTDSDTLFTQPVTPETFFKNGKIVWYYTPYDHTDTPWKPITEKFMGKEVKYEFMRRHPFMIPRWLFSKFREYCHQTHGIVVSEYIKAQPDRSFSEFNALGAFAYEKYRDKFEWVNTVEQEPPPPVVRQFFSWNGVTPEVESEIRTILGNGTACVSVTIPDPTSAIENTETPVPPQANAGDHIRWLKDYVAEKPTRRQYVLLQLKKAGLQPKWKRKS